MTFSEKFEALKKKLNKVDKSKLTEAFAIQVNLTDETFGGAFYIAYNDGIFEVEPYDYNDRSAMVTTDAKTFEDFLGGKTDTKDMSIIGNAAHLRMVGEALKKKASPKKKSSAKKKEK